MTLNNFIEIQAKVTTAPDPAHKPLVDQSAAAALGLDFAKRQGQDRPKETAPIPTLGAMPVAN